VRNALSFAAAALLLSVSASAMADSARDLGPSAEELLNIWNRDYSADAPTPSAPERLTTTDVQSDYDLRSYTPRYTRPDGGSLTPNIDRVLQKSTGLQQEYGQNPLHSRNRHRNGPGGPPTCDPSDPHDGGGKGGDCGDGDHRGHGDGGCQPVPEPGTMLLFGAAAGVAGLRKRFGRKA
jgi:hypothetical protein